MEDPVREFSDFIDEIKEKLSDAEYKIGMEMCQKLFKQEKPEEKLYKMTYLSPIVFSDHHDCEDDDCVHHRSLNIGFIKKTSLVKMKPDRAESILEENCYTGDDIEDFIDTSVLQHHQEYDIEIPEFEWDTFPVLKLDLVI
jgi:hypothetical protein